MTGVRAASSISLLIALAAYASLAFSLIFAGSNSLETLGEKSFLEKTSAELSRACLVLDLLSSSNSPALAEFSELEKISFAGERATKNFSLGGKQFSLEEECIASASGGALVRSLVE